MHLEVNFLRRNCDIARAGLMSHYQKALCPILPLRKAEEFFYCCVEMTLCLTMKVLFSKLNDDSHA